MLMLTVKRTQAGLDSPGSSIFDLPTQQYVAPGLTDNSRVALDVQLQEPQEDDDTSYIVISGGTGGNAICPAFKNASYVLPVSDDGGSSSEIIRVLGGPSIGTFREDLYIHLMVFNKRIQAIYVLDLCVSFLPLRLLRPWTLFATYLRIAFPGSARRAKLEISGGNL